MILMQHNDGRCYKLIIQYTDMVTSYNPHIRYSEDFSELFLYGLNTKTELEKDGKYIFDFRIQDDSK